MRLKRPLASLACAALAPLVLTGGGCDKLPAHGPGFDTDRLEAALDPAVGGPDTCVVIDDVKTGAEVYRYGAQSVCNRPLAPCATFHIPLTVMALDDGEIAPGQVLAWDGKPQPFKAWEHDTDLAGAWRSGSGWFFRALARDIGPERLHEQLSAFGYGQGAPVGNPESFWMGPSAGGGLFLSTRAQADFLRSLALNRLPVNRAATKVVQTLMTDVVRGPASLSDLGASCPSTADQTRSVSWWVGRITKPDQDFVFALSIESQNPLPGAEIRSRALPIFTEVGLLPPPT